MSLHRLARIGFALAALAAPAAALACPVCFNAREEARIAYLGTTGVLSLLPLGLVGGASLYARAKMRARRAAEEAARQSAADTPPAEG